MDFKNLSCDCLHERKETESTVEITLKYMPVLHYLLVAAIVISILTMGSWTNFMFFITLVAFVVYIGMNWKPMCEMTQAMKTKGIKVYGSRWSFSNPIRAVIEK